MDGTEEKSRAGAVLITASAMRTGNTGDRIYCVGIGIPIITAYSRYKIQD